MRISYWVNNVTNELYKLYSYGHESQLQYFEQKQGVPYGIH